MRIRPANQQDVTALSQLEKAVFSPERYHLMRRSQYAHLLKAGNAEILIAEDMRAGIAGAPR